MSSVMHIIRTQQGTRQGPRSQKPRLRPQKTATIIITIIILMPCGIGVRERTHGRRTSAYGRCRGESAPLSRAAHHPVSPGSFPTTISGFWRRCTSAYRPRIAMGTRRFGSEPDHIWMFINSPCDGDTPAARAGAMQGSHAGLARGRTVREPAPGRVGRHGRDRRVGRQSVRG